MAIQIKFNYIYFHLGEFFCDLFASQYIGKSLNSYLLYITENSSNFSSTHPASTLRCKVVEDFIDGNPNDLVELIKSAVYQITSKELCIRFEKPNADDIYNFLPPIIENDSQLHGILAVGWDIWEGNWHPFQDNMKMEYDPNRNIVYTILNNLIEKSIGNYIVTNKWKQTA